MVDGEIIWRDKSLKYNFVVSEFNTLVL